MARTTNNFDRKIDFISAIADLADPFNSTFLESYPEYRKDLSAYLNDEKECFMSILNKVGQDGCEVLYDRVVNYIDDISNIDTTTPSALYSQTSAVGYPYKDKKTVEQLEILTRCAPLLQNIIWSVSTNFRNSKTIAERLGLATESELSSDEISSTDSLNDELSANIYSVFDNILEKKYLYLDENDNVTDISAPRIIDFSWMINSIYHDKIINDPNFSDNLDDLTVLDFGKYNYTIYSIVCYQILLDELYTLERTKSANKSIKSLSKLAKKIMPYLYDSSKFDPIQAAWSIIFNNATIDDYDQIHHEDIEKVIGVFSKLNAVSEQSINELISGNESIISKNVKFIPRLNANSFAYQQLIIQLIFNVKSLFGIDIQDYIKGIYVKKEDDEEEKEISKDYRSYLQANDTDYIYGFCYIEKDLFAIDFDSYINDLIEQIFYLGKKIRILREDMRVMTLRNSYKGTAALIQFSTIEYLKECIGEIITQSQAKYMSTLTDDEISAYKESDSYLSQSDIDRIIDSDKIMNLDQSSVGVIEYWDYTEYFGRVDGKKSGVGFPVDWAILSSFTTYGSTTNEDIFDFYKNVLHVPKYVYLGTSENAYAEISKDKQIENLKRFLQTVYNSGVFTTRTDSNYEAIYSGNKERSTNSTPWINYKNDRDANPYISKEIHPYIWNFTNKILTFLYDSGAVTQSIQNTEYELLMKHIGIIGNIIDQYRLSKNFVDSSGYVTRYEHRNHSFKEITQSYDGIVYPKFSYQLTEIDRYGIGSDISKIDQAFIKDEGSIYQEWYLDQTLSLTDYGIAREISNLKNEFSNISSYIHDNGISAKALQYYCIDKFETAYALNPNTNTYYYKENGYPFMRPLIHFGANGENLGMLFIDAKGSIITSASQLSCDSITSSYDINDDKFPPLYMSEDGSHMLIRLNKNLLGSFIVTTHRNSVNEIEKALQLNAFIRCDDVIFDENFYNDSLIKSIDDDFYILVQRKNQSHEAYLFYIRKKDNIVRVAKQQIVNAENSIVKSGLFLNNGQRVIINTFLFNNTTAANYFNRSKALDGVQDKDSNLNSNGTTEKNNFEISSSSYDVIDNFIQLYASEEYRAQDATDFSLIKINDSDEAKPSVDLRLESIEELLPDKEPLVIDSAGFIERSKWTSVTFPFSRVFNINSDAGFNPIYIGELGKIILENRNKQFKYVKSIGGAFQLLGPQNDFEDDSPPDPGDNPDISSDDDLNDLAFARIHELYSETIDNFNKELLGGNFTDVHPYINGYASIVENDESKDGKYGIDSIGYCVLSAVNDNYVSGSVRELSSLATSMSANSRLYIFIGSGNRLYSVIPRRKTTMLQNSSNSSNENTRILKALLGTGSEYEMKFKKSYVIDSFKFGNKSISAYGNFHELVNAEIYLVNVVSNTEYYSPNFMLPKINLEHALDGKISSDLIDAHMRVPHMSVTQSYEEVAPGTSAITTDLSSFAQDEITNGRLTTYGSLVFSLTEIDSEKMNKNGFEDQAHGYDLKSVTSEIINDFYRRKDLVDNHYGDFSTLDYSFKPFSFINMNMERDMPDNIVPGYEISDSASNDEKYIIQPYHNSVAIHQDNANKYTISFWRVPEEKTSVSAVSNMIENVLPKNVKVAELNTRGENSYPPVYSHEHESIDKLIEDAKFIPKLCVQWRYHEGNKGDPIELKFTNAAAYDSVFRNDNNGCEYISLSDLGESLILLPGQQNYIDIVAPNHIQVGFTVFYNIPIMRAMVTNISDDKPKFMLTILNDKTGTSTNISVNNYALVFITNSTPQLSNSDMTYIQCYVAPLNSIDQPNPPSIQNAIELSELAFNFDVSNILNSKEKQLFTAKDIDLVTRDNKLSETAYSNVYYENNVHQVRMADVPIDSESKKTKYNGFVVADIKLDFNGLSNFHLKNSIATAHGEVIAIDSNGNKCQIIKIYGTSLNRIGLKNVLGVIKNSTEYVGTVTQNSGRKTAIQLIPPENQGF